MKISSLKDNLVLTGIAGLFLFVLLFIISRFSHLDPFSLCYIKIESDILNGNKATIQEALKNIKKESQKAYKQICQHVDTISEKKCVVADWQISPNEFRAGLQLPGCYIKGTKTIYLQPIKDESENTTKNRAQSIIKYSEFSKNFWRNY